VIDEEFLRSEWEMNGGLMGIFGLMGILDGDF
jgi:hypothetical protein